MSSPIDVESAAAKGVSPPPLALRESDTAALRPIIAALEGEFANLDAQVDVEGYVRASEQLGTTWRRLVALLALGPAPELRTCPHCRHQIRRAATRCIQCWKQSPATLGEMP